MGQKEGIGDHDVIDVRMQVAARRIGAENMLREMREGITRAA